MFMNSLVQKGLLEEMACGSNFSYVLNDNSLFLTTEYKVLQSQGSNSLLKCMKMKYNGKIQLFYIINSNKPLMSILSNISPENFMTIVSNLFSAVLAVKNNGFLSCENIDISFEHIFVDTNTYKVNLVYVPVEKGMFDDYASFESELRTTLIKSISTFPTFSTQALFKLQADLSDGTKTLEDVYNGMSKVKSVYKKTSSGSIRKSILDQTARLVAMSAPTHTEFVIDKDSFLIGRNSSAVDGVVTFNGMVSKVHCRIDKYRSKYALTDLKSANGTYINKTKLEPNKPYYIKNGDIIRLANSDFQFVVD
ncbi:MAG: FHA domain-containing protein [Ruminococcaceae bacterium]|nr:FHA domain-containing protein [Oscillospiraceae bacterium]